MKFAEIMSALEGASILAHCWCQSSFQRSSNPDSKPLIFMPDSIKVLRDIEIIVLTRVGRKIFDLPN